MTEVTWNRVGRALLGRWPSQVAAWGEEGMAAFIEELQADGLTPDAALAGIRMHRPVAEKDFPPSVAAVSDNARRDPSKPTFEEAYALIYGRGGVLRARLPYTGPVIDADAQRDRAARQRMGEIHPLVASFVDRYGLSRLRLLEVDDPIWGEKRKADLREAWDRHATAMEGRDVAAIASGRRDGLRALDPLSVLGGRSERPRIGAGE